jgi:hypothetical protein
MQTMSTKQKDTETTTTKGTSILAPAQTAQEQSYAQRMTTMTKDYSSGRKLLCWSLFSVTLLAVALVVGTAVLISRKSKSDRPSAAAFNPVGPEYRSRRFYY